MLHKRVRSWISADKSLHKFEDEENLETAISYSLCANVLQSAFLCALFHTPRDVQRERTVAVYVCIPVVLNSVTILTCSSCSGCQVTYLAYACIKSTEYSGRNKS